MHKVEETILQCPDCATEHRVYGEIKNSLRCKCKTDLIFNDLAGLVVLARAIKHFGYAEVIADALAEINEHRF